MGDQCEFGEVIQCGGGQCPSCKIPAAPPTVPAGSPLMVDLTTLLRDIEEELGCAENTHYCPHCDSLIDRNFVIRDRIHEVLKRYSNGER